MQKANINNRKTSIKVYRVQEGETIEQKMDRVTNNNEPIGEGAPIIHTERKDGVQPAYNIRTDRMEIALDAMNVVHRTATARRDNRPNTGTQMEGEDGGTESTQGTE